MKSRPNIGYVFVTQNDNTFTVKDFSSKLLIFYILQGLHSKLPFVRID